MMKKSSRMALIFWSLLSLTSVTNAIPIQALAPIAYQKNSAPSKPISTLPSQPATQTAQATAETTTQDHQSSQIPSAQPNSQIKGIYVTQYNFENTSFLHYLIKHAKAAGIDSFVVDLELIDKKYPKSVALLKENNIKYIARVIVFPDGGKPEMIENPAYWQRKYKLVQQAVAWGANQIQLDYIRYSSKVKASDQHAKNILTIIQWYKSQLLGQNIPLQVDVFGITSFGESKHIGQNIKLFSQSVDAICPMVYPSHYVPFSDHFRHPFDTVYESLRRIKKQFSNVVPIKVYAYIELSNYHFPMSHEKTLDYIKAQLKAVSAAGADGWYAWSPHNRYDNLFHVLENQLKNPNADKDNANIAQQAEDDEEDTKVVQEKNHDDASKARDAKVVEQKNPETDEAKDTKVAEQKNPNVAQKKS